MAGQQMTRADHVANAGKMIAAAAALILSGCASTPSVEVRTVRVAVPVQCTEPEPREPAWPLDGYTRAQKLDGFVQRALAERKLRDSYEDQLRTALRACK